MALGVDQEEYRRRFYTFLTFWHSVMQDEILKALFLSLPQVAAFWSIRRRSKVKFLDILRVLAVRSKDKLLKWRSEVFCKYWRSEA